MAVNMGKLDRGLRLVVAAALFILAAGTSVGDGTFVEWAFYGLGAIALLTALVGICPLYSVLGIRTCRAA
ncbi:YgaP family membrane protein [Jiella sonneratiae]|uniref:DUF2892 domain-containing protein n=1 Tax=Jiella sonneratiae TaxID=2816856 RepID=A0ABS3J151_9HYPH|nr:DUF2892 domain-containing protein [Jiella sonneratiae]MBO0903392.1 DUF2892 domain-containing protein [Jiella sonneratiae]